MKANIDKKHPYVVVEDKKTGEKHIVQRCAFVFKDPLSDIEIARLKKDNDLIFNQVERGYFISHFLDDIDWNKRFGIEITTVYPPMGNEYPESLSPETVFSS